MRSDLGFSVLTQVALIILLLIQPTVIFFWYLNIRKRRKAEEQLALNEEQLKLVIEGSQQGYWDLRLDPQEQTYISSGFFEMLGYSPGEIKNAFASWEALLHPDDRAAVDAALDEHYRGKVPFYQHEHRFRSKTGEWRWILGRGKVVRRSANGKPLRVTGTYTDVSERHRFDETITSLLRVTSSVTGGDFFDILVTELLKLMQMRYAHVGYLVGPENDTIRTVSVCLDGKILANRDYKFAGFPCENAINGNLSVIPEGVQELFPNDRDLQIFAAQSYIGVPLFNRDGLIIGLITVIDSQPMVQHNFVENVLSIFAGRAAVELEQMQFKKALSESEYRWQFALEGTGEGVWDWDLCKKTVLYSKAYKQLLGYSETEFPNRLESWTTRVHPQDLSFVMSEHERHLRGEIVSIYTEYRIKCKDGQYLWVLGRGKVMLRNEDGTPAWLVGTITDITQRKKSEQFLQDTMAKYQGLFSSMSEGFALAQLVMDENDCPVDYLLLDVNPSFVPLVDIPRDQLIGSLGSRLFGSTEPQSLAVYAHVALTGKPDHVETYYQPTQKYLSINIFSPERGKFALVFTDITERKNFEAALVKERNLLRTLVDNLPDAIYVKDLNYRKTLTNKADLANSGVLSADEVLGKTDFEVWPRELAEGFYVNDRDVIENGKSVYHQEELISSSALLPRWILTAKLPLMDQDGKVVGLLGIGREITETKLAMQEIQHLNAELEQHVAQRTSQLEMAVTELEAFSYSVSHDLRAPLQTIDGFSLVLMENYANLMDETGQGYLARIRATARRMSQLIDDLLKLSRITGSGLCRVPVNLSEIARAIAAELQANHPGRMVNWVIGPEMCTLADAGLIRIALENLMGNAWKFSSKHGCAHIEVNFYASEAGSPVYYVRDDGAGFDMTYAKKLFGPFQRMHSTAEFEGSGIGLATVQRIIHRHGGEIWTESGVEKGTTVYFTLN